MRSARPLIGILFLTTLSFVLPAATLAQSGRSEARDQRERPSSAPQRSSEPAPQKKSTKPHKLAIQVNENKPEVMNLALNNAKNVVEYYRTKGEQVSIEIVAFGPGLHMLRDDTSPVKQRIAEMGLAEPSISFIACANTQSNHAKQEQKPITLISEAKLMPSGVVRLMELQKQGFTYIRP